VQNLLMRAYPTTTASGSSCVTVLGS